MSQRALKVLGFGTYNTARHPRASVILSGLAKRGHIVRELNIAHNQSTKDRVKALSSPTAALSFFGQLATNWYGLATGSRRYRGEFSPDVIVVGYLGHFDVILARMLYPRATIVLDHLIFAADTASDRGAKGGVLQTLLKTLDSLALGVSTIAVFDTPEHLAMAPAKVRERGVVVPVGAPDEWFAARTEDPIPAVCFYGLYTPLQGATTIGRAIRILADRGADIPITMVGSGQDYEEVRELAGDADVDWIEWVDGAELPSLVATHGIALGIFGTTGKGQRVVPNKVYQSMAAGCAMITSDTPPQRAMLGDAATYVPAGDPEALADAIEALATNPQLLAERQRAARDLADRAFSDEAIVAPLEAKLR